MEFQQIKRVSKKDKTYANKKKKKKVNKKIDMKKEKSYLFFVQENTKTKS